MPGAGRAAVICVVLTVTWLIGATGSRGTGVLVAHAGFPSAMAALPDGGLLFGERASGRIFEVRPGGAVDPRPIARVPVSATGQRGLLGLAVHGSGDVFASWTDPAGRIFVGVAGTGFGSGLLQRYSIAAGGRATASGPPLSFDCALGVVVLADGRLAYATTTSIRLIS